MAGLVFLEWAPRGVRMTFSISFPALARSAHSASRFIKRADSAAPSKGAGAGLAQATRRNDTAKGQN